jgi:hypothetical protein
MADVVVIPEIPNSPVIVHPGGSGTVVTTPVVIGGTGTGPQGPTGPKGDSGGFFTYTQASPSANWSIQHDLGYNPHVVVVDSAGTQVEGSVTWIDLNSLTVQFSAAFSGVAYLS